MPVIMGRKTFESVNKPLPGRFNIVITRQPGWFAESVVMVSNLEEAIRQAETTHCREIFVIGGGEIYQQALNMASTIYLTRVHTEIDGDTFFPNIDPEQWELQRNLDFPADDKHAYPYSFQTWKRRHA